MLAISPFTYMVTGLKMQLCLLLSAWWLGWVFGFICSDLQHVFLIWTLEYIKYNYALQISYYHSLSKGFVHLFPAFLWSDQTFYVCWPLPAAFLFIVLTHLPNPKHSWTLNVRFCLSVLSYCTSTDVILILYFSKSQHRFLFFYFKDVTSHCCSSCLGAALHSGPFTFTLLWAYLFRRIQCHL